MPPSDTSCSRCSRSLLGFSGRTGPRLVQHAQVFLDGPADAGVALRELYDAGGDFVPHRHRRRERQFVTRGGECRAKLVCDPVGCGQDSKSRVALRSAPGGSTTGSGFRPAGGFEPWKYSQSSSPHHRSRRRSPVGCGDTGRATAPEQTRPPPVTCRRVHVAIAATVAPASKDLPSPPRRTLTPGTTATNSPACHVQTLPCNRRHMAPAHRHRNPR